MLKIKARAAEWDSPWRAGCSALRFVAIVWGCLMSGAPPEEGGMGKSPGAIALEYGKVILGTLAAVLIVRAFLFQGFKIPTGSMRTTLAVGDQILVSRIAYDLSNPLGAAPLTTFAQPRRGDVVVFRYPYDPKLDASRPETRNMDFVKRVVAVPGDVVEIRAKKVIVNGFAEPEGPFLHVSAEVAPPLQGEQTKTDAAYFDHCDEKESACMTKRDWMPKTVVPPGKIFVLGDNRDESYDSRFWGFVPRANIIGKALLIYWSGNDSSISGSRIGRRL